MADSKLSALSAISVPALADPLYGEQSSTSGQYTLTRTGGLLCRAAMGYRLTTETGVAVSSSDRTSQGTLYLTPDPSSIFCKLISLYDGTRWNLYTNAEISLSLTVTSGKNYDVFCYDNSGTLTLELSAAWTNDTTRADAITTQDGIYCKTGALTRRHVGTIRASGTNLIEDSLKKRFVWNRYNQLRRPLANPTETANSWSYTTATWRQANANAANQFEWVTGDAAVWLEARLVAEANVQSNSGATAKAGVGIDSTTAPSGYFTEAYNVNGGGNTFGISSQYQGYPGLGYHYAAWLEKGGDGTSNFLGDNGGDSQCGIYGHMMM